ncbi:MAG: MBL fold metallo-hydrolase [Candidatus Lokiarchaeota archaeon]|nr:MBL fold metallo-hydrolase [Candidatus Lokiarchaeota archaeon]
MIEVSPNIYLIREKGFFGALRPPENVYIIGGSDGLIYDAGYGDLKTISHVLREIAKIKRNYKKNNQEFNLNRIIPSHGHPDHFSGLKLLRKYLDVEVILPRNTFHMINSEESYMKYFRPDPYEDLLCLPSVSQNIKNFINSRFEYVLYKRLYGLTFINHPDEIININSNAYITINDEKWKILHSPGHSSDHISLYNENKGILFSGDNVLRSITTWLGPPDSDLEDYINSIEQYKELPNLKLILSAHGSPIERPADRLNEILAHRKARAQQVLNLIRKNSQSGITPKGIIRSLYPNKLKMMGNIARGWICLTLKMLERKQKIQRKERSKKILFFPLNDSIKGSFK